MLQTSMFPRGPQYRPVLYAFVLAAFAVWAGQSSVQAQKPAAPPAADKKTDAKPAESKDADKGSDKADLEFKKSTAAAEAEAATKGEDKAAAVKPTLTMNPWDWFWDWFWKGGPLMIPIALMSFVVVAFTIERAIGLRRRKVIPRKLVNGLGVLASSSGGFDPRKAYRLCQQYPSAAANVVRAMLLKVGRPLSEVERAAEEASSREAWKLNYNVRPLVLAVTVTPLMGLLGTVLGMIIAFFQTANTPIGQDRAVVLAGGIYMKLITTFAGLVVAIPALFAAHYFEGRIQSLIQRVHELVETLLPQLEKYEGKLRANGGIVGAAIEPPPVARPTPQEVTTVE